MGAARETGDELHVYRLFGTAVVDRTHHGDEFQRILRLQ